MNPYKALVGQWADSDLQVDAADGAPGGLRRGPAAAACRGAARARGTVGSRAEHVCVQAFWEDLAAAQESRS